MLHVLHIILTVYSVVDPGQDAEKQNKKKLKLGLILVHGLK